MYKMQSDKICSSALTSAMLIPFQDGKGGDFRPTQLFVDVYDFGRRVDPLYGVPIELTSVITQVVIEVLKLIASAFRFVLLSTWTSVEWRMVVPYVLELMDLIFAQ